MARLTPRGTLWTCVAAAVLVISCSPSPLAGEGRGEGAHLAVAAVAMAAAPPEKAPPVARPFDLADVRLLAGGMVSPKDDHVQTPDIKAAGGMVIPKDDHVQTPDIKAESWSPFGLTMPPACQEADRKYLLQLDSDRLLHDFRVNAGLPSSAQPLGGWEKPDCELRGHFVGHYLSACALMYRSTGDEAVKAKADAIVAELAKCQKALGGQYLSAFPATFFDRVETTGKVWAPYYTIHKIMAGMLDMYQLCDNKQALDIVSAMADYFKARTDKLSDETFQKMLGVEHGGMMEVLFNLYAVTGGPDHLALARRFDHKRVFDPLAAGRDELRGLHANTNIPKITGAARGYELTGDKRLADVATFFWDTVVGGRIYATGGTSNHEHWRTAPHELAKELSNETQECCCTYNMLKLTRVLFGQRPDLRYADYYERALLNSIFGTQSPDGMLMYFLPLESGWSKLFGTPTDSFWCCTGTGVESFAKLGDSIYFHDDGGLWVNLFIASEVKWADKGLTLRQETRFPDEEGTALVFKAAKPIDLVLRLRIPPWAGRGTTVKINGSPLESRPTPGTYCVIKRVWADGDRVEVALPMALHLERMPDDPHLAAIMYGPLVLAGRLGGGGAEKSLKSGDHVLPKDNRPAAAPAMAVDEADVAAWVEPVAGKPLEFRTNGVGRPADVTLVPLNRLFDTRYAVYWKLISKSTPWPPTEKASLTVHVDQ